MRVNAKDFTAMKGHVMDGCEIVSTYGKVCTLRNTMHGWMIYDNRDNLPITGNLKSAFDVEYFVVNGLGY
jgi:hypothetical protein